VNNTVYWQAIEHVLRGAGPEPGRPLRACLDFREPLDLGDPLELAVTGDEHQLDVGFMVDGRIRAVAAITDMV
jgi:acyl-ACP thioesterase